MVGAVTDQGMYGSDANRASDLRYEVAAWLHDVEIGEQEFAAMHAALIDRLVPTADAVLTEARQLFAQSAVAESRQARDGLL
jgi:hypothetical protein